jgi:hypothetical protein
MKLSYIWSLDRGKCFNKIAIKQFHGAYCVVKIVKMYCILISFDLILYLTGHADTINGIKVFYN